MRLLSILLILTITVSASVGHITALKGSVSLLRDNNTIQPKRGFELKESDIIKTGKNSKVQLRFNDKTVITVGKSSVFEIEKYVFGKNHRSPTAKFRIKRGFFSAVTGRIGKISPNRFKVKTKTSTIGIRGTHFKGYIEDNYEEVACLKGAITVTTGGHIVELIRGEIIAIKGGQVDNSPRKIKSSDIEKMNSFVKLDSDLQNVIDEIMLSDSSRKSIMRAVDTVLYGNYSSDEFLQADHDIENISFINYFNDLSDRYRKEEIFSGEAVKSGLYLDSNEKIKGAWIDGEETPESVVAENRGYNFSDDKQNYYWSGTEDRKAIIFKGETVGYSESNSNRDVILGQVKESAEKFSGNGELYIDFNTKFKSSKIYVGDDKYTFTNLGANSLSYSIFLLSTDHIYSSDPTIALITYFGRFYGNNLESVGLGYNLYSGDTTIKGFFTGDNIEEITISRGEAQGESNGFKWGYWNYSDDTTRGAWIEEIESNLNSIDSYRENSVKATYSGNLYGTVEDLSGNRDQIKNGEVKLTFDFATDSLFGQLIFNSGDSSWRVALYDGDIQSSDRELDFRLFRIASESGSADLTGSTENVSYLELLGDFYDNGKKVGGGVEISTADGKFVVGAFTGSVDEVQEQKRVTEFENEFYSWGYWKSGEVENLTVESSWLDFHQEKSSKDSIINQMQNSVKAKYSGSVYGVADNSEIQDGKFGLDVDFAENSVTGDVSFKTDKSNWEVELKDGVIFPDTILDFEGFLDNPDQNKFRIFSGESTPNSDEKVNFTEVRGDFYGEDTERVGGTFNFHTESGKSASGILVGDKK